ncbi:MAG: tRNA (N6-isopentenyl adenosine(37)-C2)-methylthiotransferase MiaB [Erysipelotrichaceae bacterium]|nr:tRNA (N6-isopentenyl adenosine(37)-C2)-methylthiotransferase MiaB [Erysipelotrichaceae bacterium]
MSEYRLPDFIKARKRGPYQAPIIREALKLNDVQKSLGRDLFYHVITYGCQANVRDGEVIAGILEEMGYTHTEELGEADIIILNTCAIRDNAEKRVMGEIGFLQNYKRMKPSMILGLCGCMAQEEVVVKRILKSYPVVDLIFGTHNLYELPAMIERIIVDNQKAVSVYSYQGSIFEDMPSVRSLPHKASVMIMDGCDKFCTYCIVPYTRGQQRSRLAEDVIKEVIELRDNGYKEVTLLGQNVNAYGKDIPDNGDFGYLLKKVAETGIERIRFTTSHPWDFTKEMVDAIADYDNIMPFVHLPLQSGNDEILRRMGRRYTSQQYRELFDTLKERVRDVAISTDIIVGFPGETEEQFLDTLKMVEYCKYDNAYSFVFSPRPGTPAAKMEDNEELEVKKERLYRLNDRLGYYSKINNEKWVGKTVKVLLDGPSKNNPEVFCGYTPQQKLVNFTLKEGKVGDIIDVRITEAKKNSLNGEQI